MFGDGKRSVEYLTVSVSALYIAVLKFTFNMCNLFRSTKTEY